MKTLWAIPIFILVAFVFWSWWVPTIQTMRGMMSQVPETSYGRADRFWPEEPPAVRWSGRFVTLAQAMSFQTAYGQAVLPAGTQLALSNRSGSEMLVSYMDQLYWIPISCTTDRPKAANPIKQIEPIISGMEGGGTRHGVSTRLHFIFTTGRFTLTTICRLIRWSPTCKPR